MEKMWEGTNDNSGNGKTKVETFNTRYVIGQLGGGAQRSSHLVHPDVNGAGGQGNCFHQGSQGNAP